MLAKPTTKIQPAAVKAVVLSLLFVLSTQASLWMHQISSTELEEYQEVYKSSSNTSTNPLWNYSYGSTGVSASCPYSGDPVSVYETKNGYRCRDILYSNSSVESVSERPASLPDKPSNFTSAYRVSHHFVNDSVFLLVTNQIYKLKSDNSGWDYLTELPTSFMQSYSWYNQMMQREITAVEDPL